MEGMGEFFLARAEHTPTLLPPMEAARQSGDGVDGPAGLLFDMDIRVPARAEITQTDFQNLLQRSFRDRGFRVFDSATLDQAMRAGDEAPTRFIIRGGAEYWLEQTTSDPFNTGQLAKRARLNAMVSVHDIYTGRVAIQPVDIAFDRLFYLVDDVRNAILAEVEPYSTDIAEALSLYVKPPVSTGPASDPIATVLFLEQVRPNEQPQAEAVIANAIQPGLLEALRGFPAARLIPEEKSLECFQSLGLRRAAHLPDTRASAYVQCSGARYTFYVRYQRLGQNIMLTLKLVDEKNPSRAHHPPSASAPR
jgi:hypothetical protein